MPELTVSMPAHDAESFIADAIASILRQEDVDFELIIVNDASRDSTARVVRRFQDPRIRLLENTERRGIAYCHNLVIAESESSFIAHVDSDDFLLPTALRKVLDLLMEQPDVGQAHCYDLHVDASGRYSAEAAQLRRKALMRMVPVDLDYRRALLIYGTLNNPLRTYPRRVLEEVGLFNEHLVTGVDYEMALRILERYRIAVVPEFLYCSRDHSQRTSHLQRPWKSRLQREMQLWFFRLKTCRRLMQEGQITFPNQREYLWWRLMLISGLRSLGAGRAMQAIRTWSDRAD